MQTSRIVRLPVDANAARAAKNAADDGSDGTSVSFAASGESPRTLTVSPDTSTWIPRAASIRSV
jgi:hypothetical protein